ncbi:MAG TPA: phage holin family protein [Candidatus Saccharimonas sp.]|jgi:putative membrane protein|nr:phage holin family protein [Candidatus Saccharibacteria bacterium]HPQ82261.1 phage holin family protein [Candidatus Saccharimonas sp.]
MKRQFLVFIIRWILNSFGLWVAVRIFGTGYSGAEIDANVGAFLLAGLIFSVVNGILRPAVIILALPAILVTLGLFTIIVNGLMVYISLKLSPGLQMTFWHSVLTGLVLSLVNYIVSSALELEYMRVREENK